LLSSHAAIRDSTSTPQDDYMMLLPRLLLFLLIALGLTPAALFAQATISEVPGARDHSLVSRFAGAGFAQ